MSLLPDVNTIDAQEDMLSMLDVITNDLYRTSLIYIKTEEEITFEWD